MKCGDIKLVPPFQLAMMTEGTLVIPAYRINYLIRGLGGSVVQVPILGFTPAKAEAVIRTDAQAIINQQKT